MSLVASMGFVSCNNEDLNTVNPQDQTPKSVTIKLPNMVPSRATGDAIANESKVALTNFKVFFLDGSGKEVTVPTYNEKTQKVYFQSTDPEWGGDVKELTYHFLPASTEKVVVVGNIGDAVYTSLATRVDDVPNDAPAHPSYPLYGESALAKGSAADDEGHANVYTATVNLTPRVSRFEIYGFEYTGTKYTSVTLKKIALNHYYVKSNFVSMAPVEEGKVWATITNSNAWDWVGTTAVAPWADELTLTLDAGKGKLVDGTELTEELKREGGEGATGIITYGLAHVADAANNPELVLTLEGVSGVTATPLYLNGKFTKSTAFNAGKIYRVLYSFSDTNFEQPERCVELTVTVAEWQVVPVTPEF